MIPQQAGQCKYIPTKNAGHLRPCITFFILCLKVPLSFFGVSATAAMLRLQQAILPPSRLAKPGHYSLHNDQRSYNIPDAQWIRSRQSSLHEPDSQRDTACLVTPTRSASSSWLQPRALRMFRIFSPIVTENHVLSAPHFIRQPLRMQPTG